MSTTGNDTEMSGPNRTAPAPSSAQRAARQAMRAWVTAAAARLGVTEGTVRRWIRTGRLNPSCGQVYAQVLPYLDRELSEPEQAEVDQHIAACPGCEQHFAFDGTVLRFVRSRAPRSMMPAGLQARLLAPYRGQPPRDA